MIDSPASETKENLSPSLGQANSKVKNARIAEVNAKMNSADFNLRKKSDTILKAHLKTPQAQNDLKVYAYARRKREEKFMPANQTVKLMEDYIHA